MSNWWLGKPQYEELVKILADLESLARVSEPPYSYKFAAAWYHVNEAIKQLEKIRESWKYDRIY